MKRIIEKTYLGLTLQQLPNPVHLGLTFLESSLTVANLTCPSTSIHKLEATDEDAEHCRYLPSARRYKKKMRHLLLPRQDVCSRAKKQNVKPVAVKMPRSLELVCHQVRHNEICAAVSRHLAAVACKLPKKIEASRTGGLQMVNIVIEVSYPFINKCNWLSGFSLRG